MMARKFSAAAAYWPVSNWARASASRTLRDSGTARAARWRICAAAAGLPRPRSSRPRVYQPCTSVSSPLLPVALLPVALLPVALLPVALLPVALLPLRRSAGSPESPESPSPLSAEPAGPAGPFFVERESQLVLGTSDMVCRPFRPADHPVSSWHRFAVSAISLTGQAGSLTSH